MRRAKRVIFAFGAPGETAQAPALPQRADAVASAGDDLVRVGLMADVPDQFVAGRVEYIMQRDGELDHAKRRSQMPTGHRHCRDDLLAELVGKLRQLIFRQPTEVGWELHRVEQWGYGTVTHPRGP